MSLLQTGWTTVPLGRVVEINARTLPETTDPGFEFRYIDIGSVGRGALIEEPETLTFENAPSRARRILRPGDTIVSTVRTYLRAVLPIQDDAGDLIASTGFAVLSPGADLDDRFLSWYAQSDPFIEEVVARSVGVSYPAIAPSELARFRVPVPSLAEQRAIADFLDAETARIDALIEKKRRLATKLRECRVVIMLRGVSGQSSYGGEMVDSALPWIECRPKHWDEPLLKLVARLGSGHTPSRSRPDWWVDCTIPWITTGEVAQMREDRIEYVTETREKISEIGMANSSAELHPAGTVVLSRTASAGFSAIMGSDMATSQDFVTWTCGPLLDPRYLLLCLRAMRQDLLGRLAQGSTHKTIYMPDIETIRIPLPPLAEQKAVVKAVWRSLGRIDKIIDLLDHQASLLAEHRQALITAAVTGEMEVPGSVAR